jgi:hypothetical protein
MERQRQQLPPYDKDSESAVEAAADFWSRLVDEVLDEVGQGVRWTPWNNHRDIAENLEAAEWRWRPVVDRKSANLRRAVAITQEPPEEGQRVQTYVVERPAVDEFGEPRPEDFPATELRVHLAISPRGVAAVKDLLRVWFDPNASPAALRGVLDQHPLVD